MISAQIGEEKKVGAFVSVNVSKDSKKSARKVAISDISVDLVYTYHNDKKEDFRIYPFIFLNDTILPNYKKIYEKYLLILTSRDSQNQIKVGIFK